MDSFEHLLDGVDLVGDILQAAPGVKILSTSRARLQVQGEYLFHLAGMDIPDWERPEDAADPKRWSAYSAVALFLQGARRARLGFELADGDLLHVSRICSLVGGMPLGILLATVWLEILTPGEIADQISGDISQSLDFLEADLRDVPERQRGMRAVFDHSWKLLTEREREVFQALSVFRGGFTWRAAAQVTGASLRELRALVDKSLLEWEPSGRYGIHELLRQYAAEKLRAVPAQEQAARDRHCDHYLAFLCQRKEDLKGPRQKATLKDIGLEMGNVRAGWNWAVSRDKVKRIAAALESLYLFYDMQYWFQEGTEVFERAVTALGGPDADIAGMERHEVIVLGQAMAAQASLSFWLASAQYARDLDENSTDIFLQLDLWDEMLLFSHGYKYGCKADIRAALRKGIAHWRKAEDKWRLARALRLLGVSYYPRGEHKESRGLVQEGLAIAREVGDPRELAMSLYTLGCVAQMLGEYQEARRYFRESVAVSREMDYSYGVALFLDHLGWVTRLAGDYKEAERYHRESLAIAREIGDRLGVAGSLDNLSLVAYDLGDYPKAKRLCQEGLAIRSEFGHQWSIAVSLQNLGSISVAQADYHAAEVCFQEALGIFSQEQTPFDSLPSLVGLAALLARQGRTEWALELTALASRYPSVANSRWFESIVRQHINAATADLPPDVVAAAQARGRARDLDATVAGLLVELGGAELDPLDGVAFSRQELP
jgi:predicted ATPase